MKATGGRLGRWVMMSAFVCTMSSAQLWAQTEDAADASTEERARQLFDDGSQAFSVGDYARAAVLFREAHSISGRPALLFNIYSALERQGTQLEEAATALEGYLADGEVEEPRYSQLSARLARLRARIADETSGTSAPIEPDPIAEPPQRAVEPEESGGVHPAATALLIGAGALVVSFAIFAGLSEAEDGRLVTECGSGAPSTTCSDDQLGTLRTYNTIADISWITAAVAGTTGLVLLFVLKNKPDEERARLSPWMTPNSGGATLRGSF